MDCHGAFAAELSFQVIEKEDERVAGTLHDGKVEEPESTLAEETSLGGSLATLANPVETTRENLSIRRGGLPDSSDCGIDTCEEELPHDVLPRHQELVHEEFEDREHNGKVKTGQEGVVPVPGSLNVKIFVAFIVSDAVILLIRGCCQFVELADLSLHHSVRECVEHDS